MMINLKEQAAILAHDIDKPFDFALKRRIIAALIDGRSSLLRRSITSNKTVPIECVQSFAIPIIKAEHFNNFNLDNYKLSVVTKYKVPAPVRLNLDTPFLSVTSLDGSINFAYSDITTARFNSHAGKFVSGTGRYIYHGNHVALYHNEPALLSFSMLLFRGVIENPLEVKDYSNMFKYSETNFPMPMDMMNELRRMILAGDLRIPPETQEITINDE